MAKHSEAQIRANNKYRAKTYKMINIKLRLDDDADIIKSMEEAQKAGKNYREWLREIYSKAGV